MASSTVDPERFKCSYPSSQKVRIIAKIRGFTDQESKYLKGGGGEGDSVPWISVRKPNQAVAGALSSDKATISFAAAEQSTSRKDAYEVDYCYGQNEDSCLIFSREIKPLISKVFDGQKSSVITFGARGSGKTYTIQGSEENPGLASLAVADILSMAEERRKLVTFSFYEVFQDHIYDILDPKRPEVQVLEDFRGRIKLKGLSQVSVKSTSEFQKLYYYDCNSRKPAQKKALELPRRSHKGLIIYLSSHGDNSDVKLVGKMNFVDLAGYEDARRNSSDGNGLAENTRINKSLYSILNVVYALNADESRVPYRESKLTRLLQDSLAGTSHVVMLTCLNPSFCQDTMYAVSLASRSCQVVNRVIDSMKKSKSSSKTLGLPLLKIGKPASVSIPSKRQTSSRRHFSEKKASCMLKGRKLFDEGNQVLSSKQLSSLKELPISAVSLDKAPIEDETSLPSATNETEQTTAVDKETLLSSEVNETEPTTTVTKETLPSPACKILKTSLPDKDGSPRMGRNHIEVISGNNHDSKVALVEDGNMSEKENKGLFMNEDGSPPLSARLREIAKNLKSLCSSTPSCVNIPQEMDTPLGGQLVCTNFVEPKPLAIECNVIVNPYIGQMVCTDLVETKTPDIEQNVRVNDKWEVANVRSPLETFSKRSSGMKRSLVQDYLQFLNTATKEELKGMKGIGQKRATYILELRGESPEPFKSLDDLQDIGLSAKQVKGMMRKVAGDLFS